MALKLMYITNNVEVARIAESAGVDRIFVDMEYIGKSMRQRFMNTVQNHHTVEDVRNVRSVLGKAELLVRINPIHSDTSDYCCSQVEIDNVINAGADIVMLPYFKTVEEVETFMECVGGRVRTMLLFETPEAIEKIDAILDVEGIDEVYIGLNDLSLGYGKNFMFELLADGTVEKICNKFRERGLTYGFGGIASLGRGLLPAEYVIREHYKLGSSCTILSRSFCNVNSTSDVDALNSIFINGVKAIRDFEAVCSKLDYDFESNIDEIRARVNAIVGNINSKENN